jgi:hypothetical protein
MCEWTLRSFFARSRVVVGVVARRNVEKWVWHAEMVVSRNESLSMSG